MRQSFVTAPRLVPAVRLAGWAFFCIKRLQDHKGVLQALRRCCETYYLARGAPRLEFNRTAMPKRKGGRQDAPDERKRGKGFA